MPGWGTPPAPPGPPHPAVTTQQWGWGLCSPSKGENHPQMVSMCVGGVGALGGGSAGNVALGMGTGNTGDGEWEHPEWELGGLGTGTGNTGNGQWENPEWGLGALGMGSTGGTGNGDGEHWEWAAQQMQHWRRWECAAPTPSPPARRPQPLHPSVPPLTVPTPPPAQCPQWHCIPSNP